MEHLYLLAVYGALRQEGPSNYLLNNSKYIGDFDTELIYDMYSLGSFPALIADGNTSIKMEVYEINEDTLKVLNRVQEYERGVKVENSEKAVLIANTIKTKESFFLTGTLGSCFSNISSCSCACLYSGTFSRIYLESMMQYFCAFAVKKLVNKSKNGMMIFFILRTVCFNQ